VDVFGSRRCCCLYNSCFLSQARRSLSYLEPTVKKGSYFQMGHKIDGKAKICKLVNYVATIYVTTDQRQMRRVDLKPQSRQSARLSLQSSELALPPPPPASECCPPVCSRGGTHLFWCEGGGGSQFGRRDQTLWYSIDTCIIHLRLQPNISCILH
jgi:hypothetical protein